MTRDLQKAGNVASVDVPLLGRCVKRSDRRSFAETEALKQRSLANKVKFNRFREYSLIAVVLSMINFREAFEEVRGALVLAACMEDVVLKMVSFNILTGSSSQTNWHFSGLQNIFFSTRSCSIILRIMMWRRRELGLMAHHILLMEPYSWRGQKKDRFWAVPLSSTLETQRCHIRSPLRLSPREKGSFAAS